MDEENIHVVVRIRPMQAHEKKNGDVPCVKAERSGREVQVKVGPLEAQLYRCHRCFDPDTAQSEFFAECGITDLLDSSVEGYRACAFAFGQTGAGKTFTMVGHGKGAVHRDKQAGLIARSLEYLCNKLSAAEGRFRLRISCLEIYHEHVYDLFAEERERVPLPVREHASEGFFLEGARLVECKDYEVACAALDTAVRNRQVGTHDLNSRSSRSHCVTEIHIDTAPPQRDSDSVNNGEEDHLVYRGKMTLVDLAGSERLKNTHSTGKVLQEAGFINRSLYVLGKVIAGLVRTGGDLNHKDVPFRDSKLTKLLINSLGGSSRTLLIACVSEAKGSQAETLRTLKFSMSCARIRNKPVKFLDPQEKLIVDLREEVRRLRNENKRLRSNLVTAPASTDANDNLDMAPSLEKDEELETEVRRASSARDFDDRPREQGHRTSKQKLLGHKRMKKVLSPTKKKRQQADIFYKYPQLQAILKEDKDAKKVSKGKEHSRGSVKSQNKERDLRSEGSSLSLLLEMAENENELDDVRGSQESHHSRNRQRTEILNAMVGRKAAGPLVFKNKDSPIPLLRDTRLQNYYPAQNNVRQMDAKRAELESQQLALQQQYQQQQLLQQQQQQEIEIQQASVVVDGSNFVKKKANNKPKKVGGKEKKPSPYLIPLLKEKKKKDSREKTDVNLPQIVPTQERSAQDKLNHVSSKHHPIVKAFKQLDGDQLVDEKTVYSAEEPPRGIAMLKKKAESKKTASNKQHQSLPVLLTNPSESSSSAKTSPRPAPAKQQQRVMISDMPSDSELRRVLRASITEPVLRSAPMSGTASPRTSDQQGKKPSQSSTNSAPSNSLDIVVDSDAEPDRVTEDAKENTVEYDQEFENEEGDHTKVATTTPQSLTKKLENLETSLAIKRMEMEDSPGHVTSEVEEKFRNLQLEAKAIRVELAAITGKISASKGEPSAAAADEEEDLYDDESFLDEDHALTHTGDSSHHERNDKNDKLLDAAAAAMIPPSVEEEEAQRLWFVKEKPVNSPVEVVELPVSINVKRRESSQRFMDAIGRSYSEELGMLTRSIEAHNSIDGKESDPEKHPSGDSHRLAHHPTGTTANMRPETANEYGDEDFDELEEDNELQREQQEKKEEERQQIEEVPTADDLEDNDKSRAINPESAIVEKDKSFVAPVVPDAAPISDAHQDDDGYGDDFDDFEN